MLLFITLEFMQINGRYLERNDRDFINKVSRDLESYLTSSNERNRVLLFPPLSNRHRFLIHKVAEEVKETKLVSFSIGENEKRRTVVCYYDTLNCKQPSKKPEMDDDSNVSSRNMSLSFDESNPSRARNRRPDKQLYVPKAKRSEETPTDDIPTSVKKVVDAMVNGETKTKKKKKKKNVSDSIMSENRSETVQTVVESVRDLSLDETGALEANSLPPVLNSDINVNCDDELQSEHFSSLSKIDCQRNETLEVKESIESFPTDEVSVTTALEEADVFVEEHSIGTDKQLHPSIVLKCDSSNMRRRKSSSGESWDALYDQSGQCLDSSLLDQLEEKVGKVSIETPQIDYWSAPESEATSSLIDEELGHVVEIYEFPDVFKTQDLITAFSQFKDRGFDIKWVDDTHALGVFSSRVAAREALSLKHPFIKTRPLSQGIKESKRKAQRTSEFLQPFKTRPETSALLARRLVAGALGLQVQVSKEQREEDRRKLREAKERKKLVVKQKEAAWNGDLED